MKTYYALKCDMLHADKLTVKPDENSAATVVIHTDALAAVSSARADALRWALASIETESDTWRKAAECKITGYQTRSDAVSSACARLRAIIEKELKKCPK